MRKPSGDRFFCAWFAWFWFVQFPFMTLVGNDWLFANLPRNWAILIGLYVIVAPGAGFWAVYVIVSRRFQRAIKEPANV